MRARRVGIIGGGITVGVVAVLAGAFAVAHTLTIEDERGSAIDVAPVVVGTAPSGAPLLLKSSNVPAAEQLAPAESGPAEPEPAPAPEVVTAPEPRRAAPPVPPAPIAPPAPPPVAPPVVEAPAAPTPPSSPQRPSDAQIKRWIATGAIHEARAWAKSHGWTEENLRVAMREYAERDGWKR